MKINLSGVYKSQSGKWWLWKPYIAVKDRQKWPHIETDKRGYAKTITLCRTSASDEQLNSAYHDAKKNLYQQFPEFLTLKWLWDEFTKSRRYKKLGGKTQERYTGTASRLFRQPLEMGTVNMTLGQLDARKLTTVDIRRLLDKHYQKHQAKPDANEFTGATELNHEIVVLGHIYRHGMQYFDELAKLPKSPVDGIETYSTQTREYLVPEEDYEIVYKVAQEMTGRPYLCVVMELARLLAARGVELTDELKVGDREKVKLINTQTQKIEEKYIITVNRRKGSKTTHIGCTDRLNAAWEAALSLHKITPTPDTRLLIGKSGNPVTRNAVTQAWCKGLKEQLIKRGLEKHYFWLHDLKKVGVTRSKNKGIAGQSKQMQELYDLEQVIIDAPD